MGDPREPAPVIRHALQGLEKPAVVQATRKCRLRLASGGASCLKRGLTLSDETREIWEIVSPPKGQALFKLMH